MCLEIINNKNNTASYNRNEDQFIGYTPMATLFLFEKRPLKWSNYCFLYNLIIQPLNPCLRFKLVIELKISWLSSASDIKYQPLGHSECDKICYTDSYNKQTRENT